MSSATRKYHAGGTESITLERAHKSGSIQAAEQKNLQKKNIESRKLAPNRENVNFIANQVRNHTNDASAVEMQRLLRSCPSTSGVPRASTTINHKSLNQSTPKSIDDNYRPTVAAREANTLRHFNKSSLKGVDCADHPIYSQTKLSGM